MMICRILVPCLGILLLSGCNLILGPQLQGSGNVVTHQRPVGSFDELLITGEGKYSVGVGQETAVAIQIDDNLQENITTKVHGNQLVIEPLQRYHSPDGLVGDISTPELKELHVTGSADVYVNEVLAPEFYVSVTGSGDVQGNGNSQTVHVQVTGSGDVDLSGLVAESVNVTITGSGDVRVFAVGSLHVQITGSGSLEYIGSPSVSKSITGSGDVQQISAGETYLEEIAPQ